MKTQEQKIAFKLSNIEILGASLESPSDFIPTGKHTFDITLESRLDTDEKTVEILVTITISEVNASVKLGSIMVRFFYSIQDFEKIIIKDKNGVYIIPETLQASLNRISIASSRGALFSAFKGTILHNAILPILDIE
jgi:hypothetical protein